MTLTSLSLFGAIIFLVGCTLAPSATVIAPDDPRLRYTGRVDRQASGGVRFDWSGVALEANFTGASAAIRLRDTGNTFSVYLDGEPMGVLKTEAGDSTYVLADRLGPGPHHLRIVRRTEADFGSTTVLALALSPGSDLVAQPPVPSRHLTYFGDSITTGYGNLGTSPTCAFTAETQSVEDGYAGQVAAHFGASFDVVAYHGKGVVKNYGDSTAVSVKPLPGFYPFALAAHEATRWTPASRVPDAIIINLGTNDYATAPAPSDEAFIAAYTRFLNTLRGDFPQTPLFALVGPMMRPHAEANIASAVARFQAQQGTPLYLVTIPDTLIRPDDFGCAWHPNVAGHRKIAAPLIEQLSDVLGW